MNLKPGEQFQYVEGVRAIVLRNGTRVEATDEQVFHSTAGGRVIYLRYLERDRLIDPDQHCAKWSAKDVLELLDESDLKELRTTESQVPDSRPHIEMVPNPPLLPPSPPLPPDLFPQYLLRQEQARKPSLTKRTRHRVRLLVKTAFYRIFDPPTYHVWWVLNPDDPSACCPECQSLAAASPYDTPRLLGNQLNQTPGDGRTACGWGCTCYLSYYPPELRDRDEHYWDRIRGNTGASAPAPSAVPGPMRMEIKVIDHYPPAPRTRRRKYDRAKRRAASRKHSN